MGGRKTGPVDCGTAASSRRKLILYSCFLKFVWKTEEVQYSFFINWKGREPPGLSVLHRQAATLKPILTPWFYPGLVPEHQKKKEDALENMKKNYVTHSNSSYAILIWTGLSTGTPSTCKYIKVVPRIQDLAQMRLMEDGASVYQQFCPCTLTWSNTGISWIPRSAPECTFYSKGS